VFVLRASCDILRLNTVGKLEARDEVVGWNEAFIDDGAGCRNDPRRQARRWLKVEQSHTWSRRVKICIALAYVMA